MRVGWLAMKTHHVNMILQQCAAPARSQKNAAVSSYFPPQLWQRVCVNGSCWAALTALDSCTPFGLLGPPDKLKLSSITAWTLRVRKNIMKMDKHDYFWWFSTQHAYYLPILYDTIVYNAIIVVKLIIFLNLGEKSTSFETCTPWLPSDLVTSCGWSNLVTTCSQYQKPSCKITGSSHLSDVVAILRWNHSHVPRNPADLIHQPILDPWSTSRQLCQFMSILNVAPWKENTLNIFTLHPCDLFASSAPRKQRQQACSNANSSSCALSWIDGTTGHESSNR